MRKAGRPHGLPGELIVSLTSYPERFPTLHLTLRSLLSQSTQPNRLILWIAHEDIRLIPQRVHALEAFGLEIRACDNLGSYKKLIPALEAFPKAFIATADDDLYYSPDWLEKLVAGAGPSIIACHRAHRPVRTPDGRLNPYLKWDFDVQDESSRRPSADLVPTSGAGALYPPGSLAANVTDRAQFARLCPQSDDLWFLWCARMAGTRFRKVGGKVWAIAWPGMQRQSLWEMNERGGNDAAISALEKEFGYLDCSRV